MRTTMFVLAGLALAAAFLPSAEASGCSSPVGYFECEVQVGDTAYVRVWNDLRYWPAEGGWVVCVDAPFYDQCDHTVW